MLQLWLISLLLTGYNSHCTLAVSENLGCQFVPVRGPTVVFVLVPWHFNKIFYFYIVCNGGAGECGGHENTMKTHEIGVMNFNLKEWSGPGPTKLSIALPAEGFSQAPILMVLLFAPYPQPL